MYNTLITFCNPYREFLDSENIPQKVVQDIGKFYWHFLQSGIQFLDMLLMSLQEHHGFVLEDYLEDPGLMLTCKKQVSSLKSTFPI